MIHISPFARPICRYLFTMLLSLSALAKPDYTYRIVNVYPHDTRAFTQGLVYADGFLYEGTGMNGESSLRKLDFQSGTPLAYHELDRQYFGEGVTVFEDRIIQLTWKSGMGFAYDRYSFALIEEFFYPTEGWGLTHDGQRLIMSDGTEVLHFLDPYSFSETGHVVVMENGKPLSNLNELEYVVDEIFANVWPTDDIVRIDPASGTVLGRIHLQGLLGPGDTHPKIDVLNGIAYDATLKRLFVTGKRWPKLFEIQLIPKD